MSSLTAAEKRAIEELLDMGTGYVSNFSDRTFQEFFEAETGIDIHSDRYKTEGASKAKKLRSFWKQESDYLVGKVLTALLDYHLASPRSLSDRQKDLLNQARNAAARLSTGGAQGLDSLKTHASSFNAQHLAEQIKRIEASVDSDPRLAIGTAKELFETCCKTILAERGIAVSGSPDIPALSKETFKALKLLPDNIPNSSKGSEIMKRLLSNLASVGHGIAELRNLYGTGHGQIASAKGLSPRHARLAVGSIATLATFLFETHKHTMTAIPSSGSADF